MKRIITMSVAATLLFTSIATAQYNQTRGTVFGGLTGAAAGAIIGDNSDEAGAGAAIGGVVGALAGNFLGKAQDGQAQYQYAAQQQRIYQQQNYQAAQAAQYAAQAVSVQDVVALSRSGVSDAVIATAIQQRGLQQRLAVEDIVYLSQNGVGEGVIRTMQQFGTGGQAIAVQSVPRVTKVITTRPSPPVVIQYRSGGYGYRPSGYGYGYGRPGRPPHRGYSRGYR